MIAWTHRYFPDDWLAASDSASHLKGEILRTPSARPRHWIGAGVPLAVGLLIGLLIMDSAGAAYVQGVLTLASVLAGFVITLMLFTGRVTGTEILDYETTLEYVGKIRYLLGSQIFSMGVFGSIAVFALAWLVVVDPQTPGLWGEVIILLMTGLLGLGLVRAVLLPFQIYEIHNFSLDALVEAKIQATNETVSKLHESGRRASG